MGLFVLRFPQVVSISYARQTPNFSGGDSDHDRMAGSRQGRGVAYEEKLGGVFYRGILVSHGIMLCWKRSL